MEPFGLRLEFPLLVRDDTVDLGELEDGPGAPTKYTVEEILVLLLEKGLTNKECWPEAKKKVKCSEKTFRVLKGVATANELILEEEETTAANNPGVSYLPRRAKSWLPIIRTPPSGMQ